MTECPRCHKSLDDGHVHLGGRVMKRYCRDCGSDLDDADDPERAARGFCSFSCEAAYYDRLRAEEER